MSVIKKVETDASEMRERRTVARHRCIRIRELHGRELRQLPLAHSVDAGLVFGNPLDRSGGAEVNALMNRSAEGPTHGEIAEDNDAATAQRDARVHLVAGVKGEL